jgi:hypothetical protein
MICCILQFNRVSSLQVFITAERNRASNVSSESSPVIAQSSAADEVNVIVTQDGSSIIT